MMRLRDRKRVQRMTIGLVACIAAALAAALKVSGCGWNVGSDHSVRFNPYRTEKEFGRLPPLPKYASEDQKRLFSWDREVGPDSYSESQTKTEQISRLRESNAVVGDQQPHKVLLVVDRDRDLGWTRVADSIGDGFLSNSVECIGDAQRHPSHIAAAGRDNFYGAPFHHSARTILERCDQLSGLKRRRAQGSDAAPSLLVAVAG